MSDIVTIAPELPTTPCAFDEEFLADLPYDPEVLFFDRILELDPARSFVRCRMPTSGALPLTRSQRAHPVRHPSHVAGAIMVHATGMLGFVHAYYLLGLRHHEGWVGYGTHLHKAVFRKLVPPGEPIEATCRATRQRLGKARHFIRYELLFFHEGNLCYEGDQSAVWLLTGAGDELDSTAGAHGVTPSL
jgi:3-hydroxymyristoyl/3-hydroxydecanoyl-(acyl carrier protein) dehydratase